MCADFVFRLVGTIVLAALGVYLGAYLGSVSGGSGQMYATLFGLVGAFAGLIITPFLTTRPVRAIRRVLGAVSAQTLVSGLVGLIVGLMIAALLAFPLSLLP